MNFNLVDTVGNALTGGAYGTAKQALNSVGNSEDLLKPGMIVTVTGIAGRSILINPTKEATELLKNPKSKNKGFWDKIIHFLKKRVATWGILTGVIAWFASFGIGRVQSSSENPNALLGTVGMVAKALIFAAPAASVWGQVAKNVEKVANIDPSIFLRSKGNEIIEKFKLANRVNESTLKESKEKTFILTPSEKSSETAIIQNISRDKTIKSIIMGPENSGKATFANKIAATVAEVEASASDKREVIVETIDFIDVLVNLRQQVSQNSGLKEVFTAITSQVPGIGALSGDQLADAIIYGAEQRIDEAKADGNKRLVVVLKNIECLWELARKKDGVDFGLISNIEVAICSLLNKDNKYDVVITSNIPGDKTLGLVKTYGAEVIKQNKVGEALYRCVELLESDSLNIGVLDRTAKTQLITSAVAQSLGIADEKLIRGQIYKAIEYRSKERLNEIFKEFETAAKDPDEELFIEDHIQRIRDYYTSLAKFENLSSGEIYSLLSKMTISNQVKTELLGDDNSKKQIAALSIIDELISRANDLDSLEKKAVEENVQGKKAEMESRKNTIESQRRVQDEFYNNNLDIISLITKICERKRIVEDLRTLKTDSEDLYERILQVLNKCDKKEVQKLKEQIDQARFEALSTS